MNALVLAVLLIAPANAAEGPKADARTVALVERFLKTPTAQLPPEAVDGFLAVDPLSLPKKLRKKFEAKSLELHTLKHLAAGKKKGVFRVPQQDCSRPKEAESRDAAVLKFAGYEQIDDDEERYCEQKTKCTETELMCEFTLQILLVGKGRKQEKLYFLHVKDPLMAYVAQYRNKSGGNTDFFGALKPTCPK